MHWRLEITLIVTFSQSAGRRDQGYSTILLPEQREKGPELFHRFNRGFEKFQPDLDLLLIDAQRGTEAQGGFAAAEHDQPALEGRDDDPVAGFGIEFSSLGI